MDVGTHALASLTLGRALVPRAPLAAWAFIIIAGTLADVDALSAISGPSAYMDWHRTVAHSLAASAAIGAIVGAVYLLLVRKTANPKMSRRAFMSTVMLAAFLHLAMDACQSDDVAAFWPFNAHRVATHWLANVDPWIVTILIAALVPPELARMVSDEIGAKSKSVRGRIGAIVGLALIILYLGVRANFHGDAMAAIQGRTYRGESARRADVYPESASLLTWHAIVETDHALQELTVDATPGASFDPENGVTLFKPESSPILDRAQNTDSAKRFLRFAQFPKASIEQTPEGYQVQIRDLRYSVTGETRREIIALIKTDSVGRITEEELLWGRNLRRH
jgi:membrane-bound metal-dependent hydrolase YbcI (DUF457 family)